MFDKLLNKMTVLVVTFILTVLINQFESAKILAVFPTPSISHHFVFRPLTQELAKRGHEVKVITADPAFEKTKTPNNLTEIDVHDITYNKWEELYEVTSTGDGDLETIIRPAYNKLKDIVEMHFTVPEIQKLFNEETFDLLLLEAWVRPALAFSHVYKVPVIQIGSLGFVDYNIDTVGASWHPLLYPSFFNRKLYNLTTWEKIENIWNHYNALKIMHSVEDLENAMLKRIFGPNTPTVSELQNNVDMMLLNVHPIWENNRPVPPNVVYIWGIHEKPAKELPQDLKRYLDSSKHGVIYMSLGTNVKPSLLPPHKLEMLVKVFSQLPYDVLWKWDKDELPGRTENIRISKWLPQSDLLRHPNIKVFITQGGLQSTGEAINAGVPMIGIPMLGDQWYNVEKIVHHKIGVRLDMNTLKEQELRNAIETVIKDHSFRDNIRRMSRIMHDEPMAPLERAIWWTEHVLRYGGARHLRSPAANISWTQYFELDLILLIVSVSVIALLVLFALTYKTYHHFRNKYQINIKAKIS